jgi:protein-disulfide isomerase
MENSEDRIGAWVDEQVKTLASAAEWNPDAARALARLRARDRAHVRRLRWMGLAAVTAVLAAAAFLSLAPRVCASPLLCATSIWRQVVPARPAPVPAMPAPPRSASPAAAAHPQARATASPAPPAGPQPVDAGNYVYQAGAGGYAGEVSRSLVDSVGKLEGQSAPTAGSSGNCVLIHGSGDAAGPRTACEDYKTLGSPTAPVTCEIYADYQCPPCARFYKETVPMLVSEYVQTGKLKLVHRDFPMPAIHQYAQLAVQYADAAGEIGDYDAVVARIFATQSVWSENGDIDSQLATVLPAPDMEKLRGLVQDEGQTDSTMSGLVKRQGQMLSTGVFTTMDQYTGRQYGVTGTPTLVFLYNGHSQVVTGSILFDPALLKNYINDLLAK